MVEEEQASCSSCLPVSLYLRWKSNVQVNSKLVKSFALMGKRRVKNAKCYLTNKTFSPCTLSLVKTEANVWENSRADQ